MTDPMDEVLRSMAQHNNVFEKRARMKKSWKGKRPQIKFFQGITSALVVLIIGLMCVMIINETPVCGKIWDPDVCWTTPGCVTSHTGCRHVMDDPWKDYCLEIKDDPDLCWKTYGCTPTDDACISKRFAADAGSCDSEPHPRDDDDTHSGDGGDSASVPKEASPIDMGE